VATRHEGRALTGLPTRLESPRRVITCNAITEREGAHSTSMGTHHTNMIGDMPIAEQGTRDLLEQLDAAVSAGAAPNQLSRIANQVALRAGAKRARQRTAAAIVAAARMILHPTAYPVASAAATASNTSVSDCNKWKRKIEAQLGRETTTAAAAAGQAQRAGSSTQGCAPSEVTALDGLVMLAQPAGESDATRTPPSNTHEARGGRGASCR
jgi:hypothetical protein